MMAPTCDPAHPSHLEPWNNTVPPTHEGAFASSTSGNEAEVTVNGVTRAVGYDGDYVFSLSDCVTIRSQTG